MAAPGFDEATALAPAGPGRWTAELSPVWGIAGRPNGGYLLALLARAALLAAGSPGLAPVAVTGHFLRAPLAAAAEVETVVLREGRSTTAVRATLHQGSRPCVESTVTLGTLPAGPVDDWAAPGAVARPRLRPLAECVAVPPVSPGGAEVPIMAVVEQWIDPATASWGIGQPTGRGEILAWLRHADGREIDPLALLQALDALPPATFDIVRSGWVPTLELTAYVRRAPAPGPLLVRQRAGVLVGGTVDETCDVWDSTGALVGQAHQLAGIRFREPVVAHPDR